jgi:superfamily II DNA or RNA helicase
MLMTTDLSFITNEKNKSLKDRFEVLIKDTAFFDCLVGYFYTSGFHALYRALEKTEKIRILIGISTNRQTYDLLDKAGKQKQQVIEFSHAETKEEVEKQIEQELADSEDNRKVEEGVNKFIEWVRDRKLEIRAYPSQNIHAKLYIMTFYEGDRDVGRVITGSSNFTQAGLIDNLEFNVELKNRSDYDFSRQKFDELWKDAVDVSEKYVQTIQEKTWLSQNITPYQLYLKFLYEYFKDELSQTDEVFVKYLPPEFKKLEYQEQAVLNAKKILLEYGGVFISDVVGLGKTYISAMLAGQLDGRSLVIAPPMLLEKANPGSWPNVFSDFRLSADFESLGKLDELLYRGTEKYINIIIDEAHRFRTETTITYEKLAEICRGKRVILVTATPYNNAPQDILSLLKLFQPAKKSTIPNLPDLEGFFSRLDQKLKKLDRQKDYDKYIRTVKENAREIREKVLKYLMVRRTRTEIEKYFSKDITQQGLKFPGVEKPTPLFYELNEKEDEIFSKTIALIAQKFKYARYMPMLYYQGPIKVDQLEQQSQRNMGRFMKILLVKRLESSFFAFRNSVDRFLHSYEMFIKEFDNGNVYVSKKHTNKIFELLENDDDEAVQRLIDEGKAQQYDSKEFSEVLRTDLQHDHDILLEVKKLWTHIERDPKLLKFLRELSTASVLKENHLIIFTESKETANYLFKNLHENYPDRVLCYTGNSSEATRDKVIENFDARARHPKDDYRILVSTEVLSEGVNLHRSDTVINYDIPWNPTRMMQRVGRINRVDTKHDTIYTFNFFPTVQSNDQIKLKEAAEAKINAFLTLLGGDAELLTEGEPIGSHELFNRLISKQSLEGEDEAGESGLKYLHAIKEIRDKDPDLFEKIKRFPKKARTAKHHADHANNLLTYFRRGKLQKFFQAGAKQEAVELDFISAAKILESNPDEPKQKLPGHLYDLLDKNKEAFIFATTEEMPQQASRGGRDSAAQILKILKATMKNTQKLTDDQETYLKKVIARLEEGNLPKQTTKQTLKALDDLKNEIINPFKVLAVLQTNIPAKLLEEHYAEQNPAVFGKREVILSMYLTGE